jgi:hypothetical protein
MQKLLLLFALAACSASSGCSMMLSAARTLVFEPLHYCAPKDACHSSIHNRKLAEQAWKDLVAHTPQPQFGEHYEDGFIDGFSDYLLMGGSGSPPAVPPRRYWRREFETPEGHRAIEQWYEGFAHGASAAQASGLRQLVTVPPPFGPVDGPYVPAAPTHPGAPAPPPTPPVEELPAPTSDAGPPPGTAAAPSPPQFQPQMLLPAPPLPAPGGSNVLQASYQATGNAPGELSPPPGHFITQPRSATELPPHPMGSESPGSEMTLPQNPPGSASRPFLGPWVGPRAQLYLRDANP